MNAEIKLTVAGLVYNQSIAGTYALIFSEEGGNRRFSVTIGEPEAQSIALKMNHRTSPRPLTHDLILTLLSVFGARMEKVLIYEMINDVFYSELHMRKGDMAMVVDARTSDAIALAVRSECPVFIKEEIMNVVGMDVEPAQKGQEITEEQELEEEISLDAEKMSQEELEMLTSDDLNELLNLAVLEERYELAVKIRDVIHSKKNPQNEA